MMALDPAASESRPEDLEQKLQAQETRLREMNHRLVNFLTLVQSLAAQTRAEGRTAEEYREAFLGRLFALADAHRLVFERNTGRVFLDVLAERVLQPHSMEPPGRISTQGPRLQLSQTQVVALGMILHELATNAARHGALSRADGKVELAWSVSVGVPPTVTLSWRESGGPPVSRGPNTRRGFGMTLLERAAAHDLAGSLELTFEEEGLSLRLNFPLD